MLVIIAASAIVTGIPAGAPLKTPRSFNPIASDLETGAEETGDLKGSASYGYGYYGGLSNYGYGLGYGYGGYSPYSYGSYPYGYGYYSCK